MNFIQSLRRKSDSQKKKILIMSLLILMLLVVLVWFWQIKRLSLSPQESQDEVKLPSLLEIKDQIKVLYDDTTEEVKNIKGSLENM